MRTHTIAVLVAAVILSVLAVAGEGGFVNGDEGATLEDQGRVASVAVSVGIEGLLSMLSVRVLVPPEGHVFEHPDDVEIAASLDIADEGSLTSLPMGLALCMEIDWGVSREFEEGSSEFSVSVLGLEEVFHPHAMWRTPSNHSCAFSLAPSPRYTRPDDDLPAPIS